MPVPLIRGSLAAAVLALAAVLVPAAALLPTAEAAAPPAATPAEGTVFIRVRGNVRVEYAELFKEPKELTDVELATGSGFVITPSGHVLTNHHVVTTEGLVPAHPREDVRVSAEVTRIEVLLPGESGGAARAWPATVDASDPDLDLAVLSTGAELPYLRLGDSDVVESAQALTVWGFPFGGRLELGKSATTEVAQVTTTRGLVGAIRRDDAGQVRFLQTDAAVNPGSSGGPMVDEDGFVVGVVQLKMKAGTGLGFGIPIDLAKDFLEAHGLDALLPSRRLRPGPLQAVPGKRISLALPAGIDDVSPQRLRCASSGGAGEIALRVDRVFSPLPVATLETLLVSGQAFGGPPAAARGTARVTFGESPGLAGWARAPMADGSTQDVEYAIVDLGREKIVARYRGPTADVAFNRSVLRGSLHSLEAERLLTAEIAAPVAPSGWEPAALEAPDAPRILLPAGWVREPGAGAAIRGLAAPDAAVAASPEGDFTVSLQASWWRAAALAPEAAAEREGPRSATDPAAYAVSRDRLGVPYTVEGTFVAAGAGLLQLEMAVPTAKRAFLEGLFKSWVQGARHPPRAASAR